MITKPSFNYEELLWNKGYTRVAGIDEVGRGCFAGPLVAAAVILPKSFPHQELINDSKLLPAPLRIKLSSLIKLYALAFSIVEVPVEAVNKYGIGEAGQIAFSLCATRLRKRPDYFLIDAFKIHSIKPSMQKAIIHGDSISISIAAASIIAKVHRDQIMERIDPLFPEYSFKSNKGYGTMTHRKAIKRFGLTPLHRTSFNLTPYL